MFSAIDLVPSLLKLTGAGSPEGALCDGEDVLNTLLGRSDASRQAPIFFARPPDRKNYYGFENLPDLAVRVDRWKLLCDYDGGRPELYDIKVDPGETKNLSETHPEQTEELTQEVTEWYRSMPSNKHP